MNEMPAKAPVLSREDETTDPTEGMIPGILSVCQDRSLSKVKRGFCLRAKSIKAQFFP